MNREEAIKKAIKLSEKFDTYVDNMRRINDIINELDQKSTMSNKHGNPVIISWQNGELIKGILEFELAEIINILEEIQI